MTISPAPSPPLPREWIPLPEGLTCLSDDVLRVDGIDGIVVINPAAGSQADGVSAEMDPRVLQALDGTYLPTVGPATPAALSAPSLQDAALLRTTAPRRSDLWSMASQPSGIIPAEPGDGVTSFRPITLISSVSGSPQEAAPEPEPELAPELEQEPQPALMPLKVSSPIAADSPTEVISPTQTPSSDEVPSSAKAATPAESDSSTDSAPELLEAGTWEDLDDPVKPQQQLLQITKVTVEGLETGDVNPFPDYPESEPGSGHRRRGTHRTPTAPSVSLGGSPTTNTPTASDNSKSKQPQPIWEPRSLEALSNTEVVSAPKVALIVTSPV